ncbi:hypothetical protein ACFPRL_26365 [Pseudoclavibacter helvolus]
MGVARRRRHRRRRGGSNAGHQRRRLVQSVGGDRGHRDANGRGSRRGGSG